MKRTTRKLSTLTKQRISSALKGRSKTDKHKKAISKSLVAYWKTIPDENGSSTVVE